MANQTFKGTTVSYNLALNVSLPGGAGYTSLAGVSASVPGVGQSMPGAGWENPGLAQAMYPLGIQFEGGQVLPSTMPSFANDAAAGSGGLTTGMEYQTNGTDISFPFVGVVMIKQ